MKDLKKTRKELPILLGQLGPLEGQKWFIEDQITIGRGIGCEIVISDRQVSRFHSRIICHDNKEIQLSDLGSKNGTFINGKRVDTPINIQDGDQIKIALIQEFLFISSEATLPIKNRQGLGNGKSGRLLIDEHAHRVWVHEKEIIPPLSVQQFKLLQVLYWADGVVVSREEIIQATWGITKGEGVTEQALDALVRRIRERLAEFDRKNDYLITVRGFGIRLNNPDYE